MNVKYIGTSNDSFTNGNTYKVIGIDDDGDYFVIDDFLNTANHYKSQFEVITE